MQSDNPTSHPNGHGDEITMSGWLTKQCKYSRKWKKRWFVLKSFQLMYATKDAGPYKTIPLQGAMIDEANIADRAHVFRLRPQGKQKDILIEAPNETEEQKWMEAICFAKLGASETNQSASCAIQ